MGRWSSKIQWTICKSAFLNTDTPIWTLLRCTSEGRKFQELNRVMQILGRISSPMFNVSLSSKTPPTSPPVNSYAASTPKHKCPLPWKSRGKKKNDSFLWASRALCKHSMKGYFFSSTCGKYYTIHLTRIISFNIPTLNPILQMGNRGLEKGRSLLDVI